MKMLTIVFLMNIVQLLDAQRMVPLQVIHGTVGTCASQHLRDLARQNLTKSVDNIIADIPPCSLGQWTRVAFLNMSDPVQQCPLSWRLYSANGVRACGRASGPGNSQNYRVSQQYNKVCGQIIGYQVGSTDAFNSSPHFTIDQVYIDGVSVTYRTPRKHTWTFASGISETNVQPEISCPCAFAGPPQPPSFVRNNYFCESGNPLTTFEDSDILQYTDDPLWDGKRCEGQCCSNANSPPWFSVELPRETNEPIEIRILGSDSITNEDTPIMLLEIYVQ